MAGSWRKWLNRAALFAVAAFALANAGCLAAAVGAAAGGAAAAGYFYYTAPLVRDYPNPYGDTLAAAKAALADLQFAVLKEQPESGGTVIETRTGDGVKVLVALDLVTNPVPADGSLTRVSVRVGHFGDEEISTRIQEQIAKHLPPPAPPLARPAPPPPPETAPPPLAAPVSAKK
jgi:Protein of unknown function (DUF3568)